MRSQSGGRRRLAGRELRGLAVACAKPIQSHTTTAAAKEKGRRREGVGGGAVRARVACRAAVVLRRLAVARGRLRRRRLAVLRVPLLLRLLRCVALRLVAVWLLLLVACEGRGDGE